MNMFSKMAVVVCVAAGLVASGCASFQTNSAGAKLAVQYATLKVIKRDPAKAARVTNIVTEADLILTDRTATVALAEAAVRKAIKWEDLSAEDTLLANALINAVKFELEARVGTGGLSADQVLQVRAVLAWITEAAELV